MTPRLPHDPRHLPVRRGAITVWSLMLVIALVTILAVVVEVAHLWWCRTELESALEAAALAGAKEWGQATNKNTQTPRNVAVDFAQSNTVNGKWINQPPNGAQFTTNYAMGSGLNQNATRTGNLIFGAVSLNAPFTFDANTAPECGKYITYGSAEVGFTFKASQSTFSDNNVFEINFASQSGFSVAPYISKVLIELQAAGTDDGVFDVNTAGPASEILGNDSYEGRGPVLRSGPAWSSASPNGLSPTQSDRLELGFAPGVFVAGNVLVFDADTDRVGSGMQPGVLDTEDKGGAFVGAWDNFRVTIEFNGDANQKIVYLGNNSEEVKGSSSGAQTNTPPGQTKPVTLYIPPTGAFGVRAQATLEVQPVLKSLFGVPLGPFSVSANATARSDCSNPRPQLIHVQTYIPPP